MDAARRDADTTRKSSRDRTWKAVRDPNKAGSTRPKQSVVVLEGAVRRRKHAKAHAGHRWAGTDLSLRRCGFYACRGARAPTSGRHRWAGTDLSLRRCGFYA